MSLFDRLVQSEQRNPETFKSTPGSDAFIHTDRYRSGRRNQSPQSWFVGQNKRYPVWQQRASAAGALRAAQMHHGRTSKIAQRVARKIKGNSTLKMCPSILPECPPPRNHGAGGKPEYLTKCKGDLCGVKKHAPDNHGKYPWPFNHEGQRKYDKDWTALGYAKGSQKGSYRRVLKHTQQNNPKAEEIVLSRRDLVSIVSTVA